MRQRARGREMGTLLGYPFIRLVDIYTECRGLALFLSQTLPEPGGLLRTV